MKRILIFSLAYYPGNVSGAEVAIKEITDRIEPGDIEFHMVTLRFGEEPWEENIGTVHVHRVGFGPAYVSKILFVPLAALAARGLHARRRFDAVWVVMTYMLFPAMVARMLGLRAPLVLTLQDGDPYEKVFERWYIRPFTPLLDWGFRSARAVQAISTFLAGWPRLRGYRGTVEVVPNGSSVDPARVYTQEELDAYRKKIGKEDGDVFVVSVSRLVHKNAVDDLVRALPMLPPHIKLLLVGDGSDKEMLHTLAADLGVASRVVYTGHVERSETAKYRAVCDIFARPSRSEGMGNSFASAMASRLPIIATQEGGLADFIFDAKRNPDKETTAWVVDRDSPRQIAAAVQDIIAHPEQVQKVTEHCYKLVTEVYNWDTIAKTMRDKVFSKALA